jgi:lon-related putative ATP-dependent protease
MELSSKDLRVSVSPSSLGFDSTECLEQTDRILGQKRAVSALEFGLNIKKKGFNVYAAGSGGLGKMTTVLSFLAGLAKEKEVPGDLCYVNNFKDPSRPDALVLSKGEGKSLRQEVKDLVDHVRKELPRALESEDYLKRINETTRAVERTRNGIIDRVASFASANGFLLQMTNYGVVLLPARNGKPLSNDELQGISEEDREVMTERREKVEDELNKAMKEIRDLDKGLQNALAELDRQLALFLIGGLVDDLCEKHKSEDVKRFLKAVRESIIENVELFKPAQTEDPHILETLLKMYEVNIIVDNGPLSGAPVVVEHNPSYANLFGRIEREARLGMLETDFTMIRGGSIHRANGGYLVLPVNELFNEPFSWDALKRALKNERIEIEEISEMLGFATKTLRPESFPLDVKVVLVGPQYPYYALYEYDEDFRELFKVKAEFDTVMGKENMDDFFSFICGFCKRENIKQLDKEAVAKVVEHSFRLAEDREKLSAHFGELADLLREADFWASHDGRELIGAEHIKRALEERRHRSDLVEEKIREAMENDVVFIDTKGSKVGQINGLSVSDMGSYSFGRPSRITASVGAGGEGIVDIEREVKLGGPIHSKGVMILSGYLLHHYGTKKPLSLSANLVFEQSYGGVDGDSASTAELCAILSAIADVPLKQGLAMTGSVNQRGEVQAIGGVNEKIEGFFDLCKARGLDGSNGVIIPKSNVRNLMLREDVVEAAEKGEFHVWSIERVDEAIELLTGMDFGIRDGEGRFPEGSFNYLVEKRLDDFAEIVEKKTEKAGSEKDLKA